MIFSGTHKTVKNVNKHYHYRWSSNLAINVYDPPSSKNHKKKFFAHFQGPPMQTKSAAIGDMIPPLRSANIVGLRLEDHNPTGGQKDGATPLKAGGALVR